MNSTIIIVLELAWKSALVLILPLAAAQLARRASASQRALILFLGLLSVGVLPILRLCAPQLELRWLPVEERPTRAAGGAKTLTPEEAPLTPAISMPPGTAMAPTAESITEPAWKRVLGGNAGCVAEFWATGAILVGAYFGVGCLGLRRLQRQTRPASWARVRGASPGLRTPVILESAECRIPVTWGWLRPVILFPAAAADWPASRRRHALLHEMAHVRRGDWLAQCLVQAICAGYWWHPLVWLTVRCWRNATEQACDDLALAGAVRPTDYAEDLLVMARQLAGSSHGPACAIVRKSALAQRLRYILENRPDRASVSSGLKAGLTAAALLGSFAVAALTFTPAKAAERSGGTAANSAPAASDVGSSTEANDAEGSEDPAAKWELKKELKELMNGFKKSTEDVKQLRADVQKPELSQEDKDSKRKQLGDEIAELESVERDIRELERTRRKSVGVIGRSVWDDRDVMNDLAWSLLDRAGGIRPADVELASWSAQRANELAKGQDPKILNTLARLSFIHMDFDKAIGLQKEAVAKSSGGLAAELSKTLSQYQERLNQENQDALTPQVGTPIEGKPGYVSSPYAPQAGYIDVRNVSPGSRIKDPFSGRTMLVP